MIFTVILQPGTVLAHVVYEWIVSGSTTGTISTGVTQPDSNFPMFRIDTGGVAPTGAEELVAWDNTDVTNWNSGGYRILQAATAVAGASQVILATPYISSSGPSTIVPASPAALSICRCYGTWTDISALPEDGEPMTLTLVAVDNIDPTLIYDLSTTPLKNTETGLLVSMRIVNLMLVAGALQNVNGDPFVDMNRTDYISGAPTGTNLQYLLNCDVIGAPISISLLSSTSPVVFQPVIFKLDTTTIGVSVSGTFDLSKKAVA